MKPVYGKDLCEDLKAVGECFAPWRLDIFGKGIIDKLNGSNDERIAVLKTFIEFKGSWRYDLNRETFKSDASCGVFIPSEEKTLLKRLA